MSKTLLEQISEFVVETQYSKIPSRVIQNAKSGILDFVACAVVGSRTEIAKNCLKYLGVENMTGLSVLFGTSKRADIRSAALFNGTSAHSMDFDDVSWATIGHPSASVAATCFAFSQMNNWDGKQLIRNYVLAVEAMHQIARVTMPELSERGWHTTLAYGVFGATVASSLGLKLSSSEMINALGISASRASGLRVNFGSQTKSLHAGLSNIVGIECALLAKSGFTSRPDAIEGQDGFASCFTGRSVHGSFDMGQFWDLQENGLVIKRYPCCSGSHPTNDVWDEYLDKNKLDPEQIERIEVGVSLLGPKELTQHMPQDAVQAKFSIEFAIAYRLLKGKLTLSSFSDEVVQDPLIQTFMKKIKMLVSPELQQLGFIGTAPVRLQVFLKDGGCIKLSNDLALGNPEKPLSIDMVREKFFDCTSNILGEKKAEEWFEHLQNLEETEPNVLMNMGLST